MPVYDYLILTVGWILWCLAFFVVRREARSAAKVDRRARWGVILQAVGYALLWQGSFWATAPAVWRVALSVIFLIVGAVELERDQGPGTAVANRCRAQCRP